MPNNPKDDDYGVRAIGVKTLAPSELKANPHNPRKLFDREDLHVLRQSIARVGIRKLYSEAVWTQASHIS